MSLKTSHIHEQKTLTTNQTATLQIPAYGKIHSVQLLFRTALGATVTEAQLRAQVGNIRLTIGGKDITNATVIRILDGYETLGANVGVNAGIGGVIELNFGALLYTDPAVKDIFGYGTNDVTSIQVQVTAGTLVALEVDNVQAITWREAVRQNLGAYIRFIDYPQSFNSAAEHTVDTLPRDINSSYLMVMCDDGAAGVISDGECRVNSANVMEKTPNACNQAHLSDSGLVQPAGYFVYNFTDGGLPTRLPMAGVADLRFLTTFSTAPGAAGYNMTALTVVNFPTSV